jgi:hypothetical protein
MIPEGKLFLTRLEKLEMLRAYTIRHLDPCNEKHIVTKILTEI